MATEKDKKLVLEVMSGTYRAGSRQKTNANTNPWYDSLFDTWEFLRESVDGGEDYLKRHIFSHPKELDVYFLERLRRAIFPNHAKAIVDTYTAQLYKAKITREVPDGQIDTFLKDIDGAGHDATYFFRRVYRAAYQYGHCFVNINRFDGDIKDPKSYGEQLDAGMSAQARMIKPTDLVDWQLDNKHGFEWAMVREPRTVPRSFDKQASTEGDQFQFRLWTKTGWALYTINETKADTTAGVQSKLIYTKVDEGTHPLEEVPLYAVYIGERDDTNAPVSISPLHDIAPQVRRIANLISLMDEQIYQHVFNILVVPMEVWSILKDIDFSTGGSLPDPPEGKGYKYLAPDVSQIEILQKQVTETERSIRFLSGIGVQNETAAAESGLALAYKNVDKRAFIQSSAEKMESLETICIQAANRWVNPKDIEFSIEYRVELEPGEVESALNDALLFDALGPTGLAKTENLIQAAKAHLGRYLEESDLKKVVEELRKANPDEIIDPLKTA